MEGAMISAKLSKSTVSFQRHEKGRDGSREGIRDLHAMNSEEEAEDLHELNPSLLTDQIPPVSRARADARAQQGSHSA